MGNLTWIEINKNNLARNVAVIRKIIGRRVIFAPCVKANAYGHGLVGCAKLLLRYGADWLCVNSTEETEILRKASVRAPILIIGYVGISELKKIIELDAKTVIYSIENARKLSRAAVMAKKQATVHIKVDTGMSRQGILLDEVNDFINYVKRLPNLRIEGLATHFADADSWPASAYFKKQLSVFQKLIVRTKERNISLAHAANSAAALLYPEARFNLVRPGLAIYGYYPSKKIEKICCQKKIILKPVLALKTRIAMIKEIPKGASVSYGCTFTAKRKMKIAILPIGYYDGLDRKLSNQGEVLIRGKRARILGRVCMDMIMVDVSRIKNVKQEDEAVIIGRQGREEITAEEVADKAGTINYEIITRLRESIPRYYI